MKIKKQYILRKVAGENMVVPIGKESVINQGIFQLNDVGTMLFELFQQGAEIVDAEKMLVEKFGITDNQAHEDVGDFIKILEHYKLLEE